MWSEEQASKELPSLTIHRQMLLGRMAGSEASALSKGFLPRVSSWLFGPNMIKIKADSIQSLEETQS